MMKTMCEAAGTNHLLRAYAASEIFNAGIPEKVGEGYSRLYPA